MLLLFIVAVFNICNVIHRAKYTVLGCLCVLVHCHGNLAARSQLVMDNIVDIINNMKCKMLLLFIVAVFNICNVIHRAKYTVLGCLCVLVHCHGNLAASRNAWPVSLDDSWLLCSE